MANLDLGVTLEEARLLVVSLTHCLATCGGEGHGTDGGCPDCAKARQVLDKVKAAVQAAERGANR